jgi:hypothetical protein
MGLKKIPHIVITWSVVEINVGITPAKKVSEEVSQRAAIAPPLGFFIVEYAEKPFFFLAPALFGLEGGHETLTLFPPLLADPKS